VQFTEEELFKIRERALEGSKIADNPIWIEAYKRLASAADHMQLIIRRSCVSIKTLTEEKVPFEVTKEFVANANWQPCRKKPVVVHCLPMEEPFLVHTLEGDHEGTARDYLMKGVRGELYPCKKDVFEDTYEIVEE